MVKALLQIFHDWCFKPHVGFFLFSEMFMWYKYANMQSKYVADIYILLKPLDDPYLLIDKSEMHLASCCR